MTANNVHHPLPPEFELPPTTAEIVKAEPAIAVTPMRLLEIATNQNADVDKLAKLMELQLRWEANEARKAYHAAMMAFKAEAPEIERTKHVRYQTSKGVTDYWYAELDVACKKLEPIMAKHGLTHRWRTQQVDGKIRVTCIVTHEMGHSVEEATLEASPDDTGSKNSIQAIGSTVYYLERYTFFAACGKSVKGQDNDAQSPKKWDKLEENLNAIDMCPTLEILDKAFKEAYTACKKSQDAQSLLTLINARDKRKGELTATEAA